MPNKEIKIIEVNGDMTKIINAHLEDTELRHILENTQIEELTSYIINLVSDSCTSPVSS